MGLSFHASRIASIRSTKPVGRVLGFDLVCSDSPDYAHGVRLGMLIEVITGIGRGPNDRPGSLSRNEAGVLGRM